MPDRLFLALKYYRVFGRWPNYESPNTFNELTHVYILECRNPILKVTAHKFHARKYIADRAGSSYLTPLLDYWQGYSHEISRIDQPMVLKDCCAAGRVMFCDRDSCLRQVNQELRRWRANPFWRYHREWAYRSSSFDIIAEDFLDGGSNWVPIDYKVYTFGGRAKMIQVDRNRFRNHTRNLYSVDWIPLECNLTLPRHHADDRPNRLQEMIYVSEQIAQGLEFLRVDFLMSADKLFVGELTNYSGAGFEVFSDPAVDAALASTWLKAKIAPEVSGAPTLGRSAFD